MRGDGMRGDDMRGDDMRGEGMRGDGMRGDDMSPDETPLSACGPRVCRCLQEGYAGRRSNG